MVAEVVKRSMEIETNSRTRDDAGSPEPANGERGSVR